MFVLSTEYETFRKMLVYLVVYNFRNSTVDVLLGCLPEEKVIFLGSCFVEETSESPETFASISF